MKAIIAMAVSELRIGFRNSWVMLAAAILTVFSILLVLLGTGPSGDVNAHLLEVTVASLATLAVYLIPLIALLLSFDAIAGEIDRGTLQLLFATPAPRWQVLAGKFIGHSLILLIAVCIGYGLACLLALYLAGGAEARILGQLLALTASSVLLGAVFIAIGYCASACVRQTSTAAALAVGIWLITVVLYDLALLGGLLASADGHFTSTVFPWLVLLNPADAFRLYNMAAVESTLVQTGLASGSTGLPLSGSAVLLSPLLWLLAALGLSAVAVHKVTP